MTDSPQTSNLSASRILPLFGSGKPLCFCGAFAEPKHVGEGYATLCHVHWKSERELLTEAIARAGQRLKELERGDA